MKNASKRSVENAEAPRSRLTPFSIRTRLPLRLAAAIAVLALAVGRAQAANILVNPSFETPPHGHVSYTNPPYAFGWTYFSPPEPPGYFGDYWVDNAVTPHTGSYYWKEWYALNSNATNNVAGLYQTLSSAPGNFYQASGWLYINSGDVAGPNGYIWLQVEFLDSSSNMLALYKSDNFNSSAGENTWLNYQVTNVCDLTQPLTLSPYFNTYAVTGSVDQLAAPAGTASVVYRYCYFAAAGDGGSSYLDDADLEQLTNPIPPTISSQPQSVTVNAYSNALFSVSAAGTVPFNYQWTFNGTNIPGATASSLIVTNVTQSDLGAYNVTVSNSLGSVTSSNAVLSMYPFLATPFAGLVTDWGFTNTLSVEAWGTGPLSYQWYDNGIALSDATNSTFTLSSIQFTNAGLYSVVVTSPLGSVTNTPEQVVVNPAGVSLALYPGVTITGVVGYTYNIQASTNLTDTNGWTTVETLTLTEPQQLWVDVNNSTSAHPQRFYRVVPGP